MHYREVFAAIEGVTSADGPFPIIEQEVDGIPQKVFGGLPDNLRDYFAFCASHGDKECLIDRDRRLSFAAVAKQVTSLGAALAGQYGVAKGDRVAIAMRNSPEWCISFMAITSIGAVAVPMNSWWQGEELAYGLKDCEAKYIILDAARYQRLAAHLQDSELVVIGVENEGKTLPDDVDRLEPLLTGEGVLPEVLIEPQDPAVILYTSGSTGRPRGVLSTQRNVLSALGTWLAIGTAVGIASGTIGQEPEEQPAILLTVPLFHVTGLNSLFLLSLGIGRKIVMMYKWDIDAALEVIQAEKITHFNGVPTMSMELMNHPHRDEFDLSSLLEIASGGAARPADQVGTLIERFPGAKPSAGYGLTETNAVGCIIGDDDYAGRPGSVGQATPPLVDLRLVDEDGNEVEQGERGEICLRSPAIVSGYLNQPAATETLKRHSRTVGSTRATLAIRMKKASSTSSIESRKSSSAVARMSAAPKSKKRSTLTRTASKRRCSQFRTNVWARLSELQFTHDLTASDKLAAFKVPVHIWICGDSLPRIASGKIFKKQIQADCIAKLDL
jgi:acyl-CoA synthetase (AMP-forming)/AMP-acid ligase II